MTQPAKPRLLCRLGIHRYGAWGAKFSIPSSAYAFEYQQRTCLCCGRIEERRI